MPLPGSWYHIGFHMTAAVASVPTLGLPYAVSLLGWAGGIIALIAGGLVTMFTSFLISSMLEYGGSRHIRFRDLAVAVYGKASLLSCLHAWGAGACHSLPALKAREGLLSTLLD